MPDTITLNDIIELEAYAKSLLDRAQRMRAKMQGEEQKRMKRGITPEGLARAEARLEKTMIRGRARLEANKKAGQ